MKISLYTKIFQYLHYNEIIQIAKKYGYAGLELDRLPEVGAQLLKEMVQTNNLTICSLHSWAHVAHGSNIASGNADKRYDGVNAIEKAIVFAKEVGCPIVQIKGIYCWPYALPFKGFWNRTVTELKKLCRSAENNNVKLSLHMKHSIAYVVNSPWAAKDMIEEVGSSALGVTFDAGTLNLMTPRATSLVGFVEILKDNIFHVHINDNDGYHDQKLPPGKGNINWEVLLMALRDINYNGYLSVDLQGGFQQRDPHGVAYESIKFLRSVLEKL
ncbi:MAG: sugar phosphate isomerase/epimerase [Elusimicrobiota bacterium]